MKTIIALTLALLAAQYAAAQTTSFTKEEWEAHQETDKITRDSVATLKTQLAAAQETIKRLQGDSAALKRDFDKQKSLAETAQKNIGQLNKEKAALNAEMQKLRREDATIKAQFADLREQTAEAQARLANATLLRKFNKKRVQESIAQMRTLAQDKDSATLTVRQQFGQVLKLLQRYEDANQMLKNILQAAQDDPARKDFADPQKYVSAQKAKLEAMPYYRDVYQKGKADKTVWTIPNLDAIIEAALDALSKHAPRKDIYADFTVLIALL